MFHVPTKMDSLHRRSKCARRLFSVSGSEGRERGAGGVEHRHEEGEA